MKKVLVLAVIATGLAAYGCGGSDTGGGGGDAFVVEVEGMT